MPHVREDLSVYIFKLVQLSQGLALIEHLDRSQYLKVSRIPELQPVRAIAHDQRLLITGQPPALALVVELAYLVQRAKVVDKTNARKPGKLVYLALEYSQALGKVLCVEVYFP